MYQERRLLYLYCETPLHAGSGSDLGIVDLPIQRERHTGLPKVEASSLKGAMREHFCRLGSGEKDLNVKRTFGPAPDDDDANKFAGCLAFTDARLLCFPVRSVAGVWTWVTSPSTLARFAQDLGFDVPNIGVAPGGIMVAGTDNVVAGDKVVLEEFAFSRKADDQNVLVDIASKIAPSVFPQGGALHDKLMGNLAVLHDEDFAYFAQNATEMITRVRISQVTGTVEQGALFTEEYLPAESILYSQVLSSGEFVAKEDSRGDRMEAAAVMEYFTKQLLAAPRFQLGANATLGKGHLFAAVAKTSNT